MSSCLIEFISNSFANHLICISDATAASAAAIAVTSAKVVVKTEAAAEAAEAEAAETSELQMRRLANELEMNSIRNDWGNSTKQTCQEMN